MPLSVTNPRGIEQIIFQYGDPMPYLNDKLGWQRAILVTMPLLTPLPYAYPLHSGTVPLVTHITAHRLIVNNLVATLQACLDAGVPPARLTYGGCYCWRAMRGGTALSTHTWGIAVDLDPVNNPLGEPWSDDGVRLDPRVLTTFRAAGWTCGADWSSRPDPMHMQACSAY